MHRPNPFFQHSKEMRICIIGGNSFLSTAIGKVCESQPKVSILVLGRSKPRNYSYNEYQEIDLEAQRIDASKLIDCDFIIYCAGAGIQSHLKQNLSIESCSSHGTM